MIPEPAGGVGEGGVRGWDGVQTRRLCVPTARSGRGSDLEPLSKHTAPTTEVDPVAAAAAAVEEICLGILSPPPARPPPVCVNNDTPPPLSLFEP